METPEQALDEVKPQAEPPTEQLPAPLPKPLHSRPVLQALSWIGGVAAGGITFVTVFALSSTRTCGATRAVRAQWQLQRIGPARVSAAADQRAAPKNSTAQHSVQPREQSSGAEP